MAYGGPIFLLQMLHRLLKIFDAGRVLAVGDDEQHLLLESSVQLQMVSGGDNGIEESSSSPRINFLRASFSFSKSLVKS